MCLKGKTGTFMLWNAAQQWGQTVDPSATRTDLKGITLSEKDSCKGLQIVWFRYLTLSKWWNYGDRIPE